MNYKLYKHGYCETKLKPTTAKSLLVTFQFNIIHTTQYITSRI